MAGLIISKAAGLNDSIYGKSADPIIMHIEKKVEAWEDAAIGKKLFKNMKSKNYGEKITSMTAFGEFEDVGEGGAYPLDDVQEGYSKFLEHLTFKNSFVVTKEMIEDQKIETSKGRASNFINGYYRTKERFAAGLFAGATDTTATISGKAYGTTAADGLALFSTAHTSKTGGTANQSNCFADVFSADALAYAEAAMQNFKDDNGNILNVTPDTLLIPNLAALKKLVFATIGADKDPATANNAYNYLFGRWNVIVWSELSNIWGAAANWILMDSKYNQELAGAVWYDRVPFSMRTWIDDNTDNNIWGGRARFSAGFNDWRFACIGGITDATALVPAG